MRFSDLELHPSLHKGISNLGFEQPTPIQIQALPPALEGRDILACAMTGSGKTAAFVLPILQRLVSAGGASGKSGKGGKAPRPVRALILTPTRELAAQVHEHLEALGKHTRVRAATVFGGVRPEPQLRALRTGVDVVVATPGRLLDHLRQPWFRMDELDVLVLDEADRMLDMGFLPDIRRILVRLPERRQTMLFSATLPYQIVELSQTLLNEPAQLDVERPTTAADGVRQAVYSVSENLKKGLLLEMLRSEVKTALVFTRTKHRADRLAQSLDRAGIQCDRIHGDRSQGQREAALKGFKAGRIRVLVATDVASRGIDIEALPHVINYDVPGQPEDYVHRVGRTARAGATGDALTFVTPADEVELMAIERLVGQTIERKTVDGYEFRSLAGSASASAGNTGEGSGSRSTSSGTPGGSSFSRRGRGRGNRRLAGSRSGRSRTSRW